MEGSLLSQSRTLTHARILIELTFYILCGKHSLWNLGLLGKHHSMPFFSYKAIHPVRTMVNPTIPPWEGPTPHLQVHSLL